MTLKILTPIHPTSPPVVRSTPTCPAALWPSRAIEVATTVLRLHLRDVYGGELIDRAAARRLAVAMLDAADQVRR